MFKKNGYVPITVIIQCPFCTRTSLCSLYTVYQICVYVKLYILYYVFYMLLPMTKVGYVLTEYVQTGALHVFYFKHVFS